MEEPSLPTHSELERLAAHLAEHRCRRRPATSLAVPLATIDLLLEHARQLDQALADNQRMRAALAEIAEAVGPLRCCARFERCCGLRVPAAADSEALQERAYAALQGLSK